MFLILDHIATIICLKYLNYGEYMEYVITFLEGIISFISPCMLPLLPVFISYFAGNAGRRSHTFVHAVIFVFGFSLVFITLGVFAGTVGRFLRNHQTILNIVCGAVVIALGIFYLTGGQLPFFKGLRGMGNPKQSVASTFVFGLVYAVNLTPCIGTFLSSALMLASASATALRGALLLLCYSLGLGIPFILSALLLSQLTSLFTFIKKHYRVVNIICGVFLIVVGLLIATGLLSRVMTVFV